MEPLNKIPIYQVNQVLNADDLNDTSRYLEEQLRLTRNKAIGNGILCGLEHRYDLDQNVLTIQKGIGITSMGYLVNFSGASYRRYRPFPGPSDQLAYPYFNASEEEFEQRIPNELTKARFESPVTEGGDSMGEETPEDSSVLELFELIPGTGEEGEPITDQFIVGKVLLVYLDCSDVNLDICDPNSCDNRGKERIFQLRVLVASKAVVDLLLTRSLPYQCPPISKAEMPVIEVGKVTAPILGLVYFKNLYERYRIIISNVSTRLIDAMELVRSGVQGIIDNQTSLEHAIKMLQYQGEIDLMQSNFRLKAYVIQYIYSYFLDLVECYHEIREALIDYCTCCPQDPLQFPRHLLLGEIMPDSPFVALPAAEFGNLVISDAPFNQGYNFRFLEDAYRHPYVPAAKAPCAAFPKQRIRSLISKFILMAHRFDIRIAAQEQMPIKLTPSKYGDYPLSDKAIPYYYNLLHRNDLLIKNWSFEKTHQRKMEKVYSHQLIDQTDHPLKYTHDEQNFYRIEGHIGKPYQEAIETIRQQKQNLGLSFDLVAIKAGNGAGSFMKENSCYFHDLEVTFTTLLQQLLCLIRKMKGQLKTFQYANPVMVELYEKVDTPKMVLHFQIPIFHQFERMGGNADLSPESRLMEETVRARYRTSGTTTVSEEKTLSANIPANAFNLGMGDIFEEIQTKTALGSDNQTAIYETLKEQDPDIATVDLTARQDLVSAIATTYVILDEATKFEDEMVTETDLTNFCAGRFKRRYRTLRAKIDDFRAKNGAMLDKSGTINASIQNVFMPMLNDCTLEALERLCDEYQRRIRRIREMFNLTNYSHQHPGLEHRGGVARGGTFILLYYDGPQQVPASPANPAVIDPEGRLDLSNNQIKVVKMNATLKHKIRIDVHALERPQVLREEMHAKAILTASHLRSAIATDDQVFGFKDGTVVADFFLPYLCCSDVPPITYVFPPPSVTVELPRDVFCQDDGSCYPIDVNPAGGVITVQPGISGPDANGNYCFKPNEAGEGTHTISYQVQGITSTVSVEVVRVSAEFTHTDADLQSDSARNTHAIEQRKLLITFAPLHPDPNYLYEWTLSYFSPNDDPNGPGTPWDSSTEQNPTLSFDISQKDPMYKLTLVVRLPGSGQSECKGDHIESYNIEDLKKIYEVYKTEDEREKTGSDFKRLSIDLRFAELTGLTPSRFDNRLRRRLTDSIDALADRITDDEEAGALLSDEKIDELVEDLGKTTDPLVNKIEGLSDHASIDVYGKIYDEVLANNEKIVALAVSSEIITEVTPFVELKEKIEKEAAKIKAKGYDVEASGVVDDIIAKLDARIALGGPIQ